VEAAFNSAWAPSVLKTSQKITTAKKATIGTNNTELESAVSEGLPQGSCLGPGMWNIFYNSLLKIKFTNSTKVIAFADVLLLLTGGETVSKIENTVKLELTIISTWARENEVGFNEKKSKEMLMTWRKENKERKWKFT